MDKVIRTDQPHETVVAVTAAKLAQRIDGIAGAETVLDVGNANPRMSGHGLRIGHPRCQGRHSRRRFQGILWRYEPPDFIQIEAAQGLEADMAMSVMRRIERSPQKAYAPLPTARLFRCSLQDRDVGSRGSSMAMASSRALERPSTRGSQLIPVDSAIDCIIGRGHDL